MFSTRWRDKYVSVALRMRQAVEKITIAHSHSGCCFQVYVDGHERHRHYAVLFHLPSVPIDRVDSGSLSCETQ